MPECVVRNIVVLGASAGGVEALSRVVSQFPTGLRAAVFVVQHIPPHLPSALASILGRQSRLPTAPAIDGEPIEPGRIRVAPPDHHLRLGATRVHLDRGPTQNRARPAIDALFNSAAEHHGAAVIGVILSGTLSDGAAGLVAVERRGGLALVEDPADASFAGMPLSAIAADSPEVIRIHALGTRIADAVGQAAHAMPIGEALRGEAE